MSQHADHEYLLLTLQWVERKLKEQPEHPTLAGQRSALIGAIARAQPTAETEPSAIFQKAGPEAVELRKLFPHVKRAQDELGAKFWGLNDELPNLVDAAEHALQRLSNAISAKLRKLCGVES